MADIAAKYYYRIIRDHARGRLIDLGCGKVPLYGMYKDLVSEVVCVDWPNSLHATTHTDVFADLNLPLDVEENGFDTAIASDVIEHLHTPKALFASAARLLRPEGKLLIGVPFLYCIHEMPHDFHRYTRYALEKMTEEAGLAVVSLAAAGGGPEVLSDIITKSVGASKALARIAYGVTRSLLAAPLVKRLSAATRETMPMAYFLVAQKTVRQ
ncbi:MAG: class I SAM-dependent methyltransferase [Steroidobacteraceae bacterium]